MTACCKFRALAGNLSFLLMLTTVSLTTPFLVPKPQVPTAGRGLPCHVCRMSRSRLGIAAARGCSESRVEEAVGTEMQVSNYAGARTWGRETSELVVSRDGVRELLEGLKDLRGAGSREGAVRRVAEVAGKGDVAAVRSICKILHNNRNEAVLVREAAVECLEALCGAGGVADRAACRTLFSAVQKDAAYTVRRAAFELLPKIARGRTEEEDIIELAMTFLRREDMRNQPLYKPNGDPMSLNTEAIMALGLLCDRGNTEAWDMLERRVLDDATPRTRVAAVEALSRVADGDIMASGGRRSTVHVLAVGAAHPSPAMADACLKSLSVLITAEGIGKYYG